MATTPAPPPIIWVTPVRFTAGDTLLFQLSLPAYLPSAGWSIALTINQVTPNGTKQIITVNSQPDATNSFHCFNAAGFLANQPAGVYILSEELICAAGGVSPGQNSQIYYSDNFLVGPDLNSGEGSAVPVQTTAQQMIAALATQLLSLTQNILQETDQSRNRMLLVKRSEIQRQLFEWQEVRNSEINREGIRNGWPSRNRVTPVYTGGTLSGGASPGNPCGY